MVDLTPIEGSTNIRAAGYDEAAKEMSIAFHGGPEVYVYKDVPPATFANFMAATSKGSHYHAHIRGKFSFEKKPEPKKTG